MVKKNKIVLSIPQSQIDLKCDSIIAATITNNTNNKILTDLKYTIEYNDAGNWIELAFPDIIIFNDVALHVQPFSSTTIDIYLYPEYLQYKPGSYRIKKMMEINKKKEYFYIPFSVFI